jgi:hypothetical protein
MQGCSGPARGTQLKTSAASAPMAYVDTHELFFLKIWYLPSQLPANITMHGDSGELSCMSTSEMFLFYFSFVFIGSGI